MIAKAGKITRIIAGLRPADKNSSFEEDVEVLELIP